MCCRFSKSACVTGSYICVLHHFESLDEIWPGLLFVTLCQLCSTCVCFTFIVSQTKQPCIDELLCRMIYRCYHTLWYVWQKKGSFHNEDVCLIDRWVNYSQSVSDIFILFSKSVKIDVLSPCTYLHNSCTIVYMNGRWIEMYIFNFSLNNSKINTCFVSLHSATIWKSDVLSASYSTLTWLLVQKKSHQYEIIEIHAYAITLFDDIFHSYSALTCLPVRKKSNQYEIIEFHTYAIILVMTYFTSIWFIVRVE